MSERAGPGARCAQGKVMASSSGGDRQRRRGGNASVRLDQPGLFDAPARVTPRVALPISPASPHSAAALSQRMRLHSPDRRRGTVEPVTVTVADMPDYPSAMVELAEQSIRSIPTDRVLLTYKEIWDYFGVSGATVIRRMKDGLVPGVRILHGRVLDEGPVRRLDRSQVRWLLLAVRSRRRL